MNINLRRLAGRIIRQTPRKQPRKAMSMSSTPLVDKTITYKDLRLLLGLGGVLTTCAIVRTGDVHEAQVKTSCSAMKGSGSDVLMLEPHTEASTGIMFPHLCNAMTFAGCGLRVKYGFVKVS